MKNLPESIILIYFKRKDGMPLTREEKRAWKLYRKAHGRKEAFDEEAFEKLVRYQRQRPPAEQFFKKYNIPLTTPCPYQKQETTGRVRRFPRPYPAVAASIVCLIALFATWWLFLRRETEVNRIRLTTTRGQQRQITLPDSTKIWLNAATVLSYPSTFGAGTREVTLEEGEVYFEVTKKSPDQPFIVHSKAQKITVLGTHFNVKAYAVDSSITTTLIEGKVQVEQGPQTVVLSPGQQALTGRQGQLSRAPVDLQEATAWKNKFFTFHNKRLSVVMNEVQRWFDMELVYVDPLNDVQFTITELPRSEPVTVLLDDLATSGLVQFNIKGRKIYIRKGSNIPY